MRRWWWVPLLLAIAWSGWQRTAESRARGAHEIVAVNRSGRPLEQLQFSVAGRHVTVAALEPGASARVALRCERDGLFDVTWRPRGGDHDRQWSGGRFTHGPIPMRHRFEFVRGDGIVWRSDRRPARRRVPA